MSDCVCANQNLNPTENNWTYLSAAFNCRRKLWCLHFYVLLKRDTMPFCSLSPFLVQDPVRSAIIDSCIRVTDNGRESVHRSDFYIFTLYNASNHYDQLKLGARSSEEAARWVRCLMESALKSPRKDEHIVACSHRRWQAFRYLQITLCLVIYLPFELGSSVLKNSSWAVGLLRWLIAVTDKR